MVWGMNIYDLVLTYYNYGATSITLPESLAIFVQIIAVYAIYDLTDVLVGKPPHYQRNQKNSHLKDKP